MATAVPYIAAGAKLLQGMQKRSDSRYEAQVAENESHAAGQQSLMAESLQRRSSRESLGRSAAAIASSGTGPGSSSGVLDQAAINAELDALNIRYRGKFTQYGYMEQAKLDRQGGNTALTNGFLNAGAAFLKGKSAAYVT